jgi:hypothetical protein
MATRESVRTFVQTRCNLAAGYSVPTTVFVSAVQRWSYGAGFSPPSARLIKAVLGDEYGIFAEGSRHDWVFPGIHVAPETCAACGGGFNLGDKEAVRFHLVPQQCFPVCRRVGKPKCSHPNCA